MRNRPLAIWLVTVGLGLGAAAAMASDTVSNPADTPVAGVAVRPIEKLTPAQRASLPDATRVTLKSGRVESLGVLRSEHQMRMARFAQAATLTGGLDGAGESLAPDIKKKPPPDGKLVAMKAIGGHLPVDYVAFCKAADASGCLYYPAQAKLSWDKNMRSWVDYDALVNQKVCRSEGGWWRSEWPACEYAYPRGYHAVFDPGMPPPGKPIGGNVTSTAHCSDSIKWSVDPRGAISIVAKSLTHFDYFWTGPTGSSCVVRVYVAKR